MHRVVIKKCRSRPKTFELAWFKTLFSSTCAEHCGRGGGESNPDKGLGPQVLPVSGPVWAGDSCEQHLGGTHSVSLTSHRERNIMTKVSDPTLCPSSLVLLLEGRQMAYPMGEIRKSLASEGLPDRWVGGGRIEEGRPANQLPGSPLAADIWKQSRGSFSCHFSSMMWSPGLDFSRGFQAAKVESPTGPQAQDPPPTKTCALGKHKRGAKASVALLSAPRLVRTRERGRHSPAANQY